MFLIIFALSENHTENCESFDFQRGSLACAISGNHIDQLIVKPLRAKSVRSIALAAYKCWSNLHQNGGKIVKLVKMSTDQVKITR